MKKDNYTKLTEEFIKMIESGDKRKGEKEHNLSSLPTNLASKHVFTGTNMMLLNLYSMFSNFSTNYFVSYEQAKELGGHVKKGVSSFPILIYTPIYKDSEGNKLSGPDLNNMSEDDKSSLHCIPASKMRRVFNMDDVDGVNIEDHLEKNDNENIVSCDEVLNNYNNAPELRFSTKGAYYHSKEDFINMPNIGFFTKPDYYYSTLFHELVHSTGHQTRLNRASLTADLNMSSNSIAIYSEEELVAEFGASMLCQHANVFNDQLKINSCNYLSHYLKMMKEDPSFLIRTSQAASKAVRYILGK